MKQLEKRFYAREEISEITCVDMKNKNFARDVKNTLANWGYSFEYSRKGVNITRQPETAEERLSEIIIRNYDIDIQVDVLHFASFITAFFEVEGFESMPWGERENILRDVYGVSADEKTLRNWCNKLMLTNTIVKSDEKTHWETFTIDGVKYRELVSGNPHEEERMWKYYERRRQLIQNYISNELASGRKDYKAINSEAWKEANATLWCEYGCCFYSCKSFHLNAFDDAVALETLKEIYELVKEVAAAGEVIYRCEVSLTSSTIGYATPKEGEFVF